MCGIQIEADITKKIWNGKSQQPRFRLQIEENGNIKYLEEYLIQIFIKWESKPQPVTFTVTLCAPPPRMVLRDDILAERFIFIFYGR